MSGWSADWPTAYPRENGPWTVRRGQQWGVLDPEQGRVAPVDPATDRKLPGIRDALRAGRLIGYRHGRRAVVATPDSFIKVVRPSRVGALIENHSSLIGNARVFDVPRVLEAHADGRVELAAMAGRSLHRAIRTEPSRPLDDIGELVAALHTRTTSSRLKPRAVDDPRSWVATSRRRPTVHLPAIERTAETLPPFTGRADVVVHGDLHDKNVFIVNAGPAHQASVPAFIDLDGLGLGAAEDDAANLAVHLELRNLQARTGLLLGARSCSLYRGYRRVGSLDSERLRIAERHTWFRLACLYQYRAASTHLVPQLLRAAGPRCG